MCIGNRESIITKYILINVCWGHGHCFPWLYSAWQYISVCGCCCKYELFQFYFTNMCSVMFLWHAMQTLAHPGTSKLFRVFSGAGGVNIVFHFCSSNVSFCHLWVKGNPNLFWLGGGGGLIAHYPQIIFKPLWDMQATCDSVAELGAADICVSCITDHLPNLL